MDAETDRRISVAAVLIGYPKEALMFVLSSWSEAEVQFNIVFDERSLCWRLHNYALRLYGANARKQLAEWKITSTLDFGKIVVGSIEHGLLSETGTVQLETFDKVFLFEDEFTEAKHESDFRAHQWKISTLLLLTTVAAISIAGFSRGGLEGILPALFSAWITVLGFSCVAISVTTRSPGWLLFFCFGIVTLTTGVFAFCTFSAQ